MPLSAAAERKRVAKSPEYGQYLRKAAEAQHAAEDAERAGDDPKLVDELIQRAAYYRELAQKKGKSRSKDQC